MSDDPMQSAMDATLTPRSLFGQVSIDTWYCILQKGTGKVPYDEGVHGRDERRTAIDITITPLAGTMRDPRPTKREMIAESNEWVRVVLPSLKGLGTNLAGLQNRWVRFQLVPSGRKYTDKQSGEPREATTVKFLTLYPTEQAAMDAYQAERGGMPQTAQAAPTQQAAPAVNQERDAAYKFLEVLVGMHGKDLAKLATEIANLPTVAKYFTVNSPETQALLRAKAA
jgi:hypothetical protein